MRKDAKQNITKVATEALKDPLATEREIAQRAGVGNGTAHRAIKELEQSGAIKKTDRIVEILDTDLLIVEKGQSVNYRWLSQLEDEQEVSRKDALAAAKIAEASQKRRSIMGGENTDDEGNEKRSQIIVADESTAKNLKELFE